MKKILLLFTLIFITSIFAQQKEYEVHSTSVNSKYAELGVTYLNENTVLFASSKKNNDDKTFKKDRRKNNRQLYLEIYKAIINDDGDLIQTNKFSNEENNKFFESDISFTPDGKIIYFTWNNFYNTLSRKDSAKWRTLQIMKANIDANYRLSNISHLPFNSEEYSVRSPEVSKDGKQLFFVSDMPNGYGKNDLYVVDIKNDTLFSHPKNLGENINTNKDELYPFIDRNNTLYFSSYGHKGKGRLDIFKSTFEQGEYTKAENLQNPINSSYDDFAFVINDLNDTGYFTSNRKGGNGDVDIYTFNKKKEKVCEQYITGFIRNIETKKLIDGALISMYKNSELLDTIVVANNAKYNFKLSCNENYKFIVEKENYEKNEFKFTSDNSAEELFQNLDLKPLLCIQQISGTILDKETSNPLQNVTLTFYKNDLLIDTLNLNQQSNFNYNFECNSTYKIVASLINYEESFVELNTSKTYNENLNQKLLLQPIVEFITVREQKMVKTNPIYFELNSSNLTSKAKIELQKVVESMKNHPNITIECGSHTDSRADNNYNLLLSEKRAKRTMDYIISKGISPNRISGKGYGETQLINKCSNGSRCTEVQHQMNRRTEFVITNE